MLELSKAKEAGQRLDEALERLRRVPPELTTTEKEVLADCERVIYAGLETFVEVGQALLHIRDQRLYREKYASFEDYCIERWRLSSSRARQLIRASQVVANNLESGTNVPLENEAQARALVPYTKEIQRAVLQIASDTAPLDNSGKPMITAGHLRSVAKVLTDVMNEGVMDDGSGIPKPLALLVDANITEETYERLMRQKEHIRQSIVAKEASLSRDCQPKLTGFALDLVRDLLQGIEAWAKDDGGLNPAVQEPYERAKRSIGH